jgi:hypothetical protein
MIIFHVPDLHTLQYHISLANNFESLKEIPNSHDVLRSASFIFLCGPCFPGAAGTRAFGRGLAAEIRRLTAQSLSRSGRLTPGLAVLKPQKRRCVACWSVCMCCHMWQGVAGRCMVGYCRGEGVGCLGTYQDCWEQGI